MRKYCLDCYSEGGCLFLSSNKVSQLLVVVTLCLSTNVNFDVCAFWRMWIMTCVNFELLTNVNFDVYAFWRVWNMTCVNFDVYAFWRAFIWTCVIVPSVNSTSVNFDVCVWLLTCMHFDECEFWCVCIVASVNYDVYALWRVFVLRWIRNIRGVCT